MVYMSKFDTIRRSASRWLHQRVPRANMPICITRMGLKLADAIMPEKDKLELQLSVRAIGNAVSIAKKQAYRLCKRDPSLARWFCDEMADKIDGGWLTLADAINLGTIGLSEEVFAKLFSRYVKRFTTFEAMVKYFARLPFIVEEMGYYNRATEEFSKDFSTDDETKVRMRILNDIAWIITKNEGRSSFKAVYDQLRQEL